MLDKIFLKNIQVFAHHGVYPEEQKLGQKFIISVEVLADMSVIALSDNIKDGFCYGALTARIVEFCQSNRYKTLERLCHQLGENIFLFDKSIHEVKITIEKPNAPIKATLQSVGVEIYRKRSDYQYITHKTLKITSDEHA